VTMVVMDRQCRLKRRGGWWNDIWDLKGKGIMYIKCAISRAVAPLPIHLYSEGFVQIDLLEDYPPTRGHLNHLSCTNCE